MSCCVTRFSLVCLLTSLLLPGVCAASKGHVLYSFGDGSDGAYPIAALLPDGKGNFFGTTAGGGGRGTCGFYEPYCGTVFRLTRNGTGWRETVLYAFAGGTDGALPVGQLVRDQAGNLYGITQFGGGNACNGGGCGAVFELSPQSGGGWSERILYSFSGGSDGAYPYAGLMFDGAGNLYSTTSEGGDYGNGCVFELSPNVDGSWSEKVLYSFYNYYDGAYPTAALIMDKTGNLYSTTFSGGRYNAGTVFKLAAAAHGGWKETVLHHFNAKMDGANPNAGLSSDPMGNLYGTTESSAPGGGTVFELAKSGSHYKAKVLYRFTGGKDGNDPFAGVVTDKAGNLYGTTSHGGMNGVGTVFQLTHSSKGWEETVLHNFRNSDGGNPLAGVVLDQGKNLYGTTFRGGSGTGCRFNGCGVVFEIGH